MKKHSARYIVDRDEMKCSVIASNFTSTKYKGSYSNTSTTILIKTKDATKTYVRLKLFHSEDFETLANKSKALPPSRVHITLAKNTPIDVASKSHAMAEHAQQAAGIKATAATKAGRASPMLGSALHLGCPYLI